MFNFMRLSFTWTPTDLFSIVDPRYLFWTLILISIWLLSTMPLDRKCCVPNCSNTRLDGTILHRFPNPEKDPDRFRTWLYAIGGDILALDNKTIHKYGRICHHHFQVRFHTASNRLCANATPTLNLPGVPITATAAAIATKVAPLPSTSTAAVAELHSANVTCLPGTSAPATSVGIDLSSAPSPTEPATVLDQELLLILGEDPSQTKLYGEDIQSDLAIRLQHITRKGLSREVLKELTDKYLTPANCTMIEAPTLNPEVLAAVSEAVLKRDKSIELQQKQRSSSISCVAEALTLLMSVEPKNTALTQKLMDAVKLMCDNQHRDSIIRRHFILNVIKKDIKNQLQATEIDKFLFSEGLADTLKSAKAISKSGADMKQTTKTQTALKNKPPQKYLNGRAPPQNRRPKGNRRTKEPVYKDRQDNSSKMSSRPAITVRHSKICR